MIEESQLYVAKYLIYHLDLVSADAESQRQEKGVHSLIELPVVVYALRSFCADIWGNKQKETPENPPKGVS